MNQPKSNGIKNTAITPLFPRIWPFDTGGGGYRTSAKTVVLTLSLLTTSLTLLPIYAQDTSPPTPATPPPAAASQQPAVAAALPPVSKQHRRQAEDAYLAGAEKLDHDDAVSAERDFVHAAQLDPESPIYAAAVGVARQRRLAELVRQVTAARTSGDEGKAQTLLAEAGAIDPDSPLVLEHAQPTMSAAAPMPATASPASSQITAAAVSDPTTNAPQPWRIVPNLAGPIHLAPSLAPQNFDLSGDSTSIIRGVLQAYGIHAIIDDTVEHKVLRFRLDKVSYAEAIRALSTMANVFLVPVDPTTAIAAKDDDATRKRLEHQLEETLYLPGLPAAEFTDIAQSLRGIFTGITLYADQGQSALVIRAPEDILAALNQTVHGLEETSGEVVIEVRLYEVDTSKMVNAGANIPNQFGLFNVDQAAAQLVSQNSSLVQQAIAQGLISSTASNFEIAAALIGSGLVKSSLLNSTIGVFGGGLMRTGITETGSLGVNLGLNSSETRTLDDIQLRVRDRETGAFREGTRYPVTTSTYSVGLSGSAASALGSAGNATINGVSLASLLSQTTGTSTTIPQITYEDLGVSLDATPVIEKSGRIDMKLDLKIEALTGNSVNNIPVLASRDFKSTLTVAEGQSALLSSLVSNSEINAMSGLPGISELPGFQVPINENVQKQTTQLVVVVTPHVVRRRPGTLAGPMIPLPTSLARQ